MDIEEALKIADEDSQQKSVLPRGRACVALAAEVRRLREQATLPKVTDAKDLVLWEYYWFDVLISRVVLADFDRKLITISGSAYTPEQCIAFFDVRGPIPRPQG